MQWVTWNGSLQQKTELIFMQYSTLARGTTAKPLWSPLLGTDDEWRWHRSIASAAGEFGFASTRISQCARGLQREAGGFDLSSDWRTRQTVLFCFLVKSGGMSTSACSKETENSAGFVDRYVVETTEAISAGLQAFNDLVVWNEGNTLDQAIPFNLLATCEATRTHWLTNISW